jgi:hypothetical protein
LLIKTTELSIEKNKWFIRLFDPEIYLLPQLHKVPDVNNKFNAMRRVIILIGLIILISCYSKTCYGQTKTDSVAFLKNIGTDILDGLKISKIDEKYIYKLIDSIFVKDSTDRLFYFKVFRQIRKEAGGYLAEDIDFHSKEYCITYPNEFFNLPSSDLKSFAYDIGELLRTEEEFPIDAGKAYRAEIKKRCNSKYFAKVERFSKDIFDEMESRK